MESGEVLVASLSLVEGQTDNSICSSKLLNEDDAITPEEEEDVSRSIDLISRAIEEVYLVEQLVRKNPKYVSFCEQVSVAVLPYDQRIAARNARKKYWDSGPMHDEIWDGDIGDFRETELTSEELNLLLRRRSTRVMTTKLRKLFWINRSVDIDARSHAHRLRSGDIDEEDEDDFAPSMRDKRKSSTFLGKFLGRRSSFRPTKQFQDIITEVDNDLRKNEVFYESD